jgi:hypothetical protein
MLRAYLVFLLALSALALAGQDEELVPRLTEDAVVRMLPVMRAQVAEAQAGLAALQEGIAAVEEHDQLIADIGAGKVDPLEWLRSQSKCLIAPPSAKYEPELSRWASASFYLEPVALFSFGVEAPEKVRKAAIDGETGLSVVLSGDAIYDLPGGRELKAAEDEVREFYPANKFTFDDLQYFFRLTLTSPDTSVGVLFTYTNMFAESPGGKGVPNGPLLALGLFSAGFSPAAVAESDSSVVAADGYAAALARAGMTEESYGFYLGALVMAKNDAADPSVLDQPLDAPGLSADQAEAMKEMRDFYAVRKSNLKVYRKFASQVNPLLEALGQ